MAMRVCIETGCPALTKATRCTDHARAKDKARGTRQQRGYDTAHDALRVDLSPKAIGRNCHFCGEPMIEGQRLALDHTEDRAGYRGMVHLSCNAADGGRRSNH